MNAIVNPTIHRLSRTALALSVVGLVVFTVSLAETAGDVGITAGVLLAVSWVVAPSIYAVGVGFVLATVLSPDGFIGPSFAPFGAGLLCILVAPLIGRDDEDPVVFAVAATVGLLALLTVSGGTFLWRDELIPAAMGLLGAFALMAYGIHRYELVRLGLVEGSS